MAEWIDVAARDAVNEGDIIGVQADGMELALYAVEGELYASTAWCNHGRANLCDGFLEGHAIECPLHQGQFDIRTGEPLCEPVTRPIRVFPVKVEAERILVDIAR